VAQERDEVGALQGGLSLGGMCPGGGQIPPEVMEQIQRQLQNPMALALLEGTYGEGDTVRVDLEGEGLRFTRVPGT